MNRKKLDDVLVLVNQKINTCGLECLEVEWESRERILRLYVSRTGETTKLSDCIEVNNLLGECAELDDAIDGSYNLEVSSPGLNRPLRLAKSYKEAIDETIRINIRVGGFNKVVTGRLIEAADSTIILETKEGHQTISLASVTKARVVYDHTAPKGLVGNVKNQ